MVYDAPHPITHWGRKPGGGGGRTLAPAPSNHRSSNDTAIFFFVHHVAETLPQLHYPHVVRGKNEAILQGRHVAKRHTKKRNQHRYLSLRGNTWRPKLNKAYSRISRNSRSSHARAGFSTQRKRLPHATTQENCKNFIVHNEFNAPMKHYFQGL